MRTEVCIDVDRTLRPTTYEHSTGQRCSHAGEGYRDCCGRTCALDINKALPPPPKKSKIEKTAATSNFTIQCPVAEKFSKWVLSVPSPPAKRSKSISDLLTLGGVVATQEVTRSTNARTQAWIEETARQQPSRPQDWQTHCLYPALTERPNLPQLTVNIAPSQRSSPRFVGYAGSVSQEYLAASPTHLYSHSARYSRSTSHLPTASTFLAPPPPPPPLQRAHPAQRLSTQSAFAVAPSALTSANITIDDLDPPPSYDSLNIPHMHTQRPQSTPPHPVAQPPLSGIHRSDTIDWRYRSGSATFRRARRPLHIPGYESTANQALLTGSQGLGVQNETPAINWASWFAANPVPLVSERQKRDSFGMVGDGGVAWLAAVASVEGR